MEAAYLAVRGFGLTDEQMAEAVRSFKPLPHRIERVGELDGVLYVDDSKATTVEAMRAALEAFDRPVLLLAGGVWKGGDLDSVVPLLGDKVRAVGLFGASREVFEAAWAGKVDLAWSPTLGEAVRKLRAKGAPGDVMLLSPATSSFDLYSGYKARGDDFQRIFHELGHEAGHGPLDGSGMKPGDTLQ
jgi:UDP-N-acetylmuramoylalanine--D-glutamate ligase